MKKKKYKKRKSNKLAKIFALAGLLIVIIAGSMVGYFYMAKSINPILKNIYQILPLPVVRIENSDVITSRQLLQDTTAVKKFYESKDYSQQGRRVDFSTREGLIRLQIKEKDVLNKLVEDSIIRRIAQSKGIVISSQDVDEAIKKSLIKADSNYKKLAVNLNSNYGWTIEQFKDKIVKNQLYLNKLFQWYKANLRNSDDFKRALEARESILADGSNFNEVVHKFSDGESVEQDGKISWIEEESIIPEVASALSKMKEGEISDIIISPLGMHIIILEKRREVKDEGKGVKKEVQLRQIFIHSKSFIDWIQEQKKQMRVDVFLKEYQWDKNTGEIDFSNPNLRKLVKTIKIKSQGDPSL